MRTSTIGLIAATLALAAGPPAGVPDELPRAWSLEEIAKATPPFGVRGRVYPLAWKVVEDDRPLRVESCLVLKDDGEGRWTLTHLYRHPMAKDAAWRLSEIHVTGEPGTKYYPGLDILHVKRFAARPGNKDVYAALGLEGLGWKFGPEDGWRFVGCGVCEENWRAALGEKPTRFFGR
jgi:hypothetical protein